MGTYCPICMFPTNSECLIGISDAFSAFCFRVSVIFPTCSLHSQQNRASSALHPQAMTYIIIIILKRISRAPIYHTRWQHRALYNIHVHARRHSPSPVPWISDDRLLSHICKVHACLVVTCHLHFWQNDRDLLRATAVARGWNGN